MPLYEFGCPAGHVTEKRTTDYGLYVIACGCGLDAERSKVNRINFGGFASTTPGNADFSQDYRRFTEATAEIDYKATRLENEGATVETPKLFKAAKSEALKMAAAGVTSDAIRT